MIDVNLKPHQQLERKFGEWSGCGWGPDSTVACSSGTAALHLAVQEFARPGDYVIVPNYTMVAVPRAVVMAGCRPVFVGCDQWGRMSVDATLRALAALEKTGTTPDVVIVAPHHYGLRPRLDRLWRAIDEMKYDLGNINVVEDLAEAHGTPPHPKSIAACWSFYKNKIVAGEEGGMVAVNPQAVNDVDDFTHTIRSMRCLGFGPVPDYRHSPGGHNYRLADSLARLVLKSLDHVDENLAIRRELERMYRASQDDGLLSHLSSLLLSSFSPQPWVYPVVFSMPDDRDSVVSRLRDAGIEARPGFVPMTEQPEFAMCPSFGRVLLPWECVAYLPLTPGEVTDETVRRTKELITQAMGSPSASPSRGG